jgi:hypothetical protein
MRSRFAAGLNLTYPFMPSNIASNSPVSVLHSFKGFLCFSAMRPFALKIKGPQPLLLK